MNAIENGKLKKIDADLLSRLHDYFDMSIDYLLGYDTEHLNYDNKAACDYTGLNTDAVKQLHFWKSYLNREQPRIPSEMDERQLQYYQLELTRIDEAKWILYIINKLLEQKGDENSRDGIADLTILYDIYMMSLDKPEVLSGIPKDVMDSDIPFFDKIVQHVRISSENVSFSDGMGGVHQVDIGKIQQQIWQDRLLKDLDQFVSRIKAERTAHTQLS